MNRTLPAGVTEGDDLQAGVGREQTCVVVGSVFASFDDDYLRLRRVHRSDRFRDGVTLHVVTGRPGFRGTHFLALGVV